MAIKTAAGTKVYLGPSIIEATTDTLAEYEALTPWVEIKGVTTTPEVGDESTLVTSMDLGGGRVQKAKGTRDSGSATLTVNWDPSDDGQLALIAAEATPNVYGLKIVYNDKLNATGTNSEEYMGVIVRGKRRTGGDANAVLQRTFNCDVTTQVYEKPATAGA